MLTLAAMFLHFVDHPEPDIATSMVSRLEKRWAVCDQPLFMLALILNPYEGLSRFSSQSLQVQHPFDYSHYFFAIDTNLVQMYRHMKTCPSNGDLPDVRIVKKRALSKAFLQYLAGTGPFSDWKDERESFEDIMISTTISAPSS